jgi:cytochrome P450
MLLQMRDEETGEGMSDQQLRDEVITIFAAGHETTANALAWTFVLLSEHPAVARRLRAELDLTLAGRNPTVDDLPRLPYAACVVKEALRLYPPAWILSRNVVADDHLCGYHVPAGSVVLMSPYVVQRQERWWPNPSGFDPDRFAVEVPERPKLAWFPFGAGPRLCIGNGFAMMEAQLILATVAQRWEIDLVPGAPIRPAPLLTLRPGGPIPVRLRARPTLREAA